MNRWSNTRYILAGGLTLAFGFGGFGVWAVASQLEGAVVASGQVEVEARHQTLQHPDGGLVATIETRDGDRVTAGQPLIRLDATELVAQQTLLGRELYETLARIDRLLAEVKGDETLTYRPELLDAAHDPDVAQVLEAENALFYSRRDTLAQTEAALAERIVQTGSSIDGYARQIAAGNRQLELILDELTDQGSLLARGLTQASRVSALQREAAELEGRVGQLEASTAEARSAIAGYEIERLREKASRREEAQDQLRTVQPKEIQLRENIRVIETRLGRLVLRAPMAGRVLGLQTHTIGGVIAPGNDILSVVPEETPLIFTVRIDPRQVDRVLVGQPAMINFPNFNSHTTPSFHAEVRTVSPDTMTDPATNMPYYTAELKLTAQSRKDLERYTLQPGMPLETFIQTDSRTPASFLTKPIADYMSHAMREE